MLNRQSSLCSVTQSKLLCSGRWSNGCPRRWGQQTTIESNFLVVEIVRTKFNIYTPRHPRELSVLARYTVEINPDLSIHVRTYTSKGGQVFVWSVRVARTALLPQCWTALIDLSIAQDLHDIKIRVAYMAVDRRGCKYTAPTCMHHLSCSGGRLCCMLSAQQK